MFLRCGGRSRGRTLTWVCSHSKSHTLQNYEPGQMENGSAKSHDIMQIKELCVCHVMSWGCHVLITGCHVITIRPNVHYVRSWYPPTWSRKHFAMSSRDPLAPSNKSRNELGRNQHGSDIGMISSITLLPHAYPWWNSYTA